MSRFDPETDELSNIILTQTPYRGKGYIQASGTDFLQPPNNRNLCGVVYGILHVDVPENQRESLEHNNVVADMVMIQCNATGNCKKAYNAIICWIFMVML